MSSRALHFEIPVDEPDRAGAFYRAVLGWDPQRWGDVPYWTVAGGSPNEPGIAGALTLRSEAPAGVLLYLAVADIDATLEKVTASGGLVATPRQAVPGVGWMARFTDTEGNVLGLIQEDASARGPDEAAAQA